MKDLFCLVNAFMNRAKTEEQANSSGLEVPFEAAEDVRVLPGASTGATRKNTVILAALEPYLSLLPDLGGVDLKDQRNLHKALYSAGVSAALSLHKFIYESPDGRKEAAGSNPFSLSDLEREGADWKEIFNHLGKFIAMEDSAETLRKMSYNVDEFLKVRHDGGGQSLMKMISNEVAAAALAAFASATLRRPPTKVIESLMAASQEAPTSTDEEGYPRSIRDSSLVPPLPNRNDVLDLATMDASKTESHPNCPQKTVPPNCTDSNSSSIAAMAGDEDDDECDCDDVEYEEIEDEDCLFRYVCAAGYEDLAQLLVRMRNGSTDFTQRTDSTPLMEACCAGHADVVRMLLNISPDMDVNTLSSTQNTALIYACAAGHIDCVKELLKTGRCDLTIRNENGHCALMEAASIGNVDILKLLVEHGATPLSVVDNLDFKESALTLAAYKGHVAAVEYLISVIPENADRDEEFHTALMEASMDGHVEVARALLNAGAPVNLPSDSFESPLTLAACGGHTELVALLIGFGADLEEPNDEGYTPLMEASREGHRDVVELLLDRGANVNARIDEGVETPLTLAASGGFRNVVELLVARGGDLTLGDRTPLFEATQEGHIDVVEYIVQALRQMGSTEIVERDLNIALICAAEINNVAICNLLIENGASIEALSPEGRTPLMEAAKQGNMLVVELLVHKSATVNTVSPTGECTALSLAASNGHADVLRYLLEQGADPHQILKDSSTCLLEASKNGHTNCVEILLDYKAPNQQGSSGRAATEKKSTRTANGPAASSQIKSTKNIRPKAKSFTQKAEGVGPVLTPAQTNLGALQASSPVPQKTNTKSSQTPTSSTSTTSTTSTSSLTTSTINPANDTPNASQLFRALATAAAGSPRDDWLFAQFVQRSLISSKKRETMTEEELRTFTEMIQQQYRSLFPSGQVDAAALVSSAGQQALNNIYAAAALASAGAASDPAVMQLDPAIAGLQPNAESSSHQTLSSDTPSDESPSPPTVVCCPQAATKIQQTGKQNKPVSKTSTPQAVSSRTCAVATNSPIAISTNTPPIKQKAKEEKSTDSITKKTTALSLNQKISESAELVQSKLLEDLSICSDGMPPPPPFLPPTPPYCPTPPMLQSNEISTTDQDIPLIPPQLAIPTRGRRTGHPHRCPNNHSQHKRSVSNVGASAGGTPLSSACSPGLPNVAGQHSAFVDQQTESNHDTALTQACSNGHTSTASALIKRGADIEHRDKKGFTPLILCAIGGHVETARILIEAGAQLDAQADRTKDTALSLACSGGRKEVVELLLKAGANKEHRNISDYTPLSLAASGGYVDIIQMLLNHGAEINSRTGSKLGISPLMLSAMNGHEAATLLLLENGSDINAQIETNRNTALTLACFQGRTEVVRLLLQYGANVEHRAKTGLTPLMEAANGGYVEVGTLLLDSDADPNAPPVPTSRDTALTIAADKGHAAFVELLIHASAQVNVRNKKGCSALWLACSGGHLETVQTLVKHNADTDAQDNRKVSPLMVAFRKGHFKIVKYIVRHVTQFPSDQECDRYLATITDQDLITKCRQCIEFIQAAKAKQAEEANRAAQSLLDMLAQEEAMAESKKRTKQRQKEKKRAKKNARKQMLTESEDGELLANQLEGENGVPENKAEENRLSSSSPSTISEEKIAPTPLEDTVVSNKINASLRAIQEEGGYSAMKSVVPEERVPSGVADTDLRVPIVEVTSPRIEVSPSKPSKQPTPPATHSRGAGRRQPRRSRNEQPGKSATSTASGRDSHGRNNNHAHSGTNGSTHTSNTGANGSSHNPNTSAKALSNEEAEWLRASKKKVAMGKSGAASKNASKATPLLSALENMDSWTNAEPAPPTRRRSQVMSVSSAAIARVIGRAGSNINAIREATNAHIEVEKMTTRREQATRQITIKGTPESVQNSVAMIDMLIRDNDTLVCDIIKEVLGNAVTHMEAAPTRSSPENMAPTNVVPVEVSCKSLKHDESATMTNSKQENTPNLAPTNVTNVWQQRAAIREMQKCQKKESDLAPVVHTTAQPLREVNVFEPAAASPTSSRIIAPSLSHSLIQPAETQEIVVADKTTLTLSQEEHQRKAPGYARPTSSAAQNASPSLPVNSTQNSASTTVSKEEQKTTFTESAEEKRTLSAQAEIVNEVPKPRVISEIGAGRNLKPRPLSDIWESTSSMDFKNVDPLSPPTMNLAGLFTGGVLDSKTALWLPHSSLLTKSTDHIGKSDDTKAKSMQLPDDGTGWLSAVENGHFPFSGASATSTSTTHASQALGLSSANGWDALPSGTTMNNTVNSGSSSGWNTVKTTASGTGQTQNWSTLGALAGAKISSVPKTQQTASMIVQRPASSTMNMDYNMQSNINLNKTTAQTMAETLQRNATTNVSGGRTMQAQVLGNLIQQNPQLHNGQYEGNHTSAGSANSTVIKSYLESMQLASPNEFRMAKGLHDLRTSQMQSSYQANPMDQYHPATYGSQLNAQSMFSMPNQAAPSGHTAIIHHRTGMAASGIPHSQHLYPHSNSANMIPAGHQPGFVHPPPGFGQTQSNMTGQPAHQQLQFYTSNVHPPIGSRPRVGQYPTAVTSGAAGSMIGQQPSQMPMSHPYYGSQTDGLSAPIGNRSHLNYQQQPQLKPMTDKTQQPEGNWSWGF